MNTNLTTLINEFAKNNRVGKARVEELVSKVVSNCQITTPKKVRIPKQKIEKTSRNARRDFIKNEIETMAKNFEVFSVLGVAKKLYASPYLVHKIIMECQSENTIKMVDKVKNGKRGRSAIMFMINS